MSNVPWEFRDLVSTEGLKKRPQVQATPFDDIRFWLSPASVESAGVCEQLQRAALLETIAPCDQLRKLVPSEHATTFAAPKAAGDLFKLASRIERVKKNALAHRRKIAGMLAEFKAAMGGCPNDPEPWARLEKSCLDCLHAQILAEAV
jgi:hypothetical protein